LWVYAGIEYVNLEKYQRAIECYEKAIKIEPQHKNALLRLGLAHFMKGNFQMGIEYVKKCVDIDSQYEDAWHFLGFFYSNIKNHQKAIECYEKAIETNPQIAELWVYAGIEYVNLEKYQRAIECYEKAIEIEPQQKNALLHLGGIYGILGNFQRGIEYIKNSIDIDSQYGNAWHVLGIIYSNLKKHQEAIECFEKTVEINPQIAVVWVNTGIEYLNLRKYQRAIEYLDRSTELDPQNIDIWFYKLDLCANLVKNYPKAIECLKRILEIDPENKRALSAIIETKINLDDIISSEQLTFIELNQIKKINNDLEKFIKQLNYIERIKNDIKKYAKMYKRIHFKKLAEKCNCPETILESVLEDLISQDEIKGFISGDYFVQDTMKLIIEFFIKNRCKSCHYFKYESKSCSILDEDGIYSRIEKNEKCIFFKEKEKLEPIEIRNLQSFLNSVDEVEIVELANKFRTSIDEIETLLKDLIREGIINGEISGSKFVPIKKFDYEQLEEYQPETGNLCGVCYGPTENQEVVKCRNCNATFHKDCILIYVEEHRRCPLCSSLFGWI
ncbi:MAG: tetratricopeptide repeat protein, partial [Candidatus Hodarchaeota archaeon]